MESEVHQQGALNSDPLETLISLLSELPTIAALKELNNGKKNGNVRQVVETMAIQKDDLIKTILLLIKRERIAMILLEQHYKMQEVIDLLKIDWSTVNISFDECKKD